MALRRVVWLGSVAWVGAWTAIGCEPEPAPERRELPNGSTAVAGGQGGRQVPPTPTIPNVPGELRELYEQVPTEGCGNSLLDADEVCDDGNRDNADGCAANCRVIEEGYVCGVPGLLCEREPVCGDSLISAGRDGAGENCDDGNGVGQDGCSATCRIEANFACPTPGEACVSTVRCGDSVVTGAELCDDGAAVAGDGCSAQCEVEPGYECLQPGVRCTAVCGDGLVNGREGCDDGNTVDSDGCSATCQLEPGFVCRQAGVECQPTVCRDGTREGSEPCDDGNDVPYDGCSPTCALEPQCREIAGVYQCAAVCGDGLKFPEEACDDGNTQNDDGCSDACELEPGFLCTDQGAVAGAVLELPIIYRDFSSQHPQFEIDPVQDARLPGIVLPNLNANGRPVYNPQFSATVGNQTRALTMDGPAAPDPNAIPTAVQPPSLLSPEAIAERFEQWYADSVDLQQPEQGNQTVIDILSMDRQADGSFLFSASLGDNPPTQFFPLDGQGFGQEGNPNNFHFTSEARQWFVFQGGELLRFTGDDDVWVFINGLLTVDLGGIHGEIEGSIELSATGENSLLCVQDTANGPSVCTGIDVPVFEQGVNEIVVYQAERHITQSNYTLTLRGFDAPRTVCVSDCGDGLTTGEETCDDGRDLNGSGYGFCSSDCTPGPRCGDAELQQEQEQCDNGSNLDRYLTSADACAPGCETPSFCGDGAIDSLFGEACDDGEEANDGRYGGCNDDCSIGPRCGDGELNGDEQCDDGNRLNADGCDVACLIERSPA